MLLMPCAIRHPPENGCPPEDSSPHRFRLPDTWESAQKVLTDSLRSMEEDGIITRTVFPEVLPRVEYALSELGESMRPIIKSMEARETDYE